MVGWWLVGDPAYAGKQPLEKDGYLEIVIGLEILKHLPEPAPNLLLNMTRFPVTFHLQNPELGKGNCPAVLTKKI